MIRLWQLLNAAALLVAYFAPWFYGSFSPMGGELRPISAFFASLVAFVVTLLSPVLLFLELWGANFAGVGEAMLMLLGAASFAVAMALVVGYAGMSAYAALADVRPAYRRWLTVAPIAMSLSLLLASTCAVLWDGLPSVLWGYWLMWMAIGSSLAAEVYDTRRPGRVPRPSPSIDAEANVKEQDAVLAQVTELLLK
jgi:hypothetical protein